MSKKARAIFLSVSFTVFVLSVALYLILSNIEYHEALNSDSEMIRADVPIFEMINHLCIVPILVNELSWIRSTYKLLKYRPERVKKVCYIISSALSFSSIAFFLISWATSEIIPVRVLSPDFVLYGCLFLGWPAVFVSFILGSIPVRKRKGAGGASIGDAPPADPTAEPELRSDIPSEPGAQSDAPSEPGAEVLSETGSRLETRPESAPESPPETPEC